MKHGISDHFPAYLLGGVATAVILVLSVSYAVWYNQAGEQTTKDASSVMTTTEVDNERAYQRLIRADKQALQALLDARAMPNIMLFDTLPVITGETATDKAIKESAQLVGLQPTGAPLLDLMTFEHSESNSEPVPAQPYLFADLAALLEAAHESNVPLRVVRGYVSLGESQATFVGALDDTGVTAEELASSQSKELVRSVLMSHSPPGYAWEHTGFAIDFACSDLRGERFIESACYSWLRRSAFTNALLYGFVPILPDYDEREQLMNLRPWQYVWVGRDATYVN